MKGGLGTWPCVLLLGTSVMAQAPQDAAVRAFRVEEKAAETLSKVPGLKERYALVIGISKYANPTLNLSFAAADAQSLSKLLVDPEVGAYKPENVRVLYDEQATRKNIVSALNTWLKNRVTSDDSVVIFYSGHGALGGDSEAYWVTYDADVEDLGASSISNKEISAAIGALPAKRKITLIDSCYSEATAKKYRAVVPTNVFDEFKGTGVVTITASTGVQKSVEVDGHGAFTYHLLGALQGQADANNNGVVELDEVWTYLDERVPKTAADAGNKQTPVLMAERMEHGFPLTVNPARSSAPVIAALKTMYSQGVLALDEMAEAENAFAKRDTNPELRNLYRGLAGKEVNIQYFRQLRNVLKASANPAPAGPSSPVAEAAPAAPRAEATPAPAAAPLPNLPPTGPAAATGAELEAFRAAEAIGTFDGWLRYLQQFPQGFLSGSVRQRLEEMDRRKADQAAYELARRVDQEVAWKQFLVLYPNSPHVAEAERRMGDLRQKRETEIVSFRLADSRGEESAWRRFLDEFPTGQLAAIAEERIETLKKVAREKEDLSYAQARRTNALEDWDRYINSYPSGRYLDEASARRAALAKKLEEERLIKAENEAYAAGLKDQTVAAWNAYLAAFPNGPHAGEATRRIAQLGWVQFADVVRVPGGAVSMGSEQRDDSKPVHKVEVDGFMMGRSEVTIAQYLKFVEEARSRRPGDPSFVKNYVSAHPELPVLGVTYDEAVAYCRWLSEKTGLVVRLPTESEWEYAATGGKPAVLYPWGSTSPRDKARYKDNAPGGIKTVTATLFPPTAFGLLNMSGNAAEWVMDYYSENYYKTSAPKNPRGPASGKERVVRGGSWKSNEEGLQVTRRTKRNPTETSDEIGFRVVIELAAK